MPKETPPTAAAPDLAAENAALKVRIAGFEAAEKQAAADELLIREKMSKGLRREQARAVLQRQRDYDARKKSKETNHNH
ncbi:MAG: hypothetical protein ACLQVY_12695 [Limisphaerales bacterium]